MMLQDKVVVVSGVGPGLGRAVAVGSARAGADVVLAARSNAVLDEVAAEVEQAGRKAVVVPTDITDPAAAGRLVKTTMDIFGRVDVLVNNAFAVPPIVPLVELDPAAVHAEMDTDVFGALRLTQLMADHLAATGGSMVMVSSVAARLSRPGFGAYKMTKSALIALAQTLATELGPRGVRVNVVVPGSIWAAPLREYYDYLANERGVTTAQVYEETAANLDLRRLPEAEEVANAVLFLASDLARAITGQCLDVNGGEYHH
ncbi:SDR family oxidoreductase [Micromonospora peucetia]|uniref:SDR family oxidoreductase n=1 Tax=Micromonospora peucetia TaxID=47871 RepID=A0ABZ1ENF9_9ACTN|nr:SDR family oxidoreductase [Micromonospora peucetia]WSA35809.1 SDR family oxidoreductase [Micromonospora peucetia]